MPLASAQTSAPGPARTRAVTFGGTSRIEAETSTERSFGQAAPPSFLRWTLTPTMNVYGIPFGVDLLYTTETQGLRTDATRLAGSLNLGTQQLTALVRERLRIRLERLVADQAAAVVGDTLLAEGDSLRMEVDSLRARAEAIRARVYAVRAEVEARRAQIERLTALAQRLDRLARSGDVGGALGELRQTGLVSRLERRALRFPALGLGTVTPQYGTYSLAGLPTLGASLEFAPGLPYLAVVGGRVRDPLPGDALFLDPTVDRGIGRTLVGTRLGLGRPSGSHLLVTGLLARDDTRGADTLSGGVTPERNVLAGLSLGLGGLGGRLLVKAEGNASLYTRDVNAPSLDSTLDDANVPSFLTQLGGATLGSSVDAAGEARLDWRSDATTLSLGGLYVGPGYVSLGAPGLIVDRLAFDGRAEQQFMNRQVLVGAQVETERDNLGDTKETTSNALRTGLTLGLTRPSGLFVRLSGRRDARTTESAASALTYTATTVNGQTGLTLRRGDLSATTMLVGLYSGLGGPGLTYTTTTLALTETVARGRHALSLTYGYTGRGDGTSAGGGTEHRGDARLSTSFRRVRVGLGGSFDRSRDYGGLTSVDASVGLPLGPLGDLDLRAESAWISAGLYAPTAYQRTRAGLTLVRSF